MDQTTQGDQVSLELHQVPSAGVWKVEEPNSPLFDWDADLVRVALHRLRIPFLDQDLQCSMCGQVLDRFFQSGRGRPQARNDPNPDAWSTDCDSLTEMSDDESVTTTMA